MIRRLKLSEISPDEILCRDIRAERNEDAAVDEIIASVRARGDAALYEYAEKFDHAKLDALEVTPAELDLALIHLDQELVDTLTLARDNIREFHRHQLHENFVLTRENGAVMGLSDNSNIYI